MADGWLTTRNKSKVQLRTGRSKYRTSLVKQKSGPGSNFLLTQTSPPPKQLLSATKQSSLTQFFRPINFSDEIHEIPFHPEDEECPVDVEADKCKFKTADHSSLVGNKNQGVCMSSRQLNKRQDIDDCKTENNKHNSHCFPSQSLKQKSNCNIVLKSANSSKRVFTEFLFDSDEEQTDPSHVATKRNSKRRRLMNKIERSPDTDKNDSNFHPCVNDNDINCDEDYERSGMKEFSERKFIENIINTPEYICSEKTDVLYDLKDDISEQFISCDRMADDSSGSFLLKPTSQSFQSLDLDSEFTLRSQKEKYDALEKHHDSDDKNPNALAMPIFSDSD